jgi:hypothetical protein
MNLDCVVLWLLGRDFGRQWDTLRGAMGSNGVHMKIAKY